jgi:hypothetical protein
LGIELSFLFGSLSSLRTPLLQENKRIAVVARSMRVFRPISQCTCACAYHLKKLLKFVSKKAETMANEAIACFSIVMNQFGSFMSFLSLQ